MKNLSSITSIKLGTILGYECFIPKDYFTPISFLQPNCPIWIKTTSNGDCTVFLLNNGFAFTEIADFIKENLDKREGYYCKKPNDMHQLSCQILDNSDTICAEILIDNNLNIVKITLGNEDENDLLKNYFLMEYNIRGYKSSIIRIPNRLYNEGNQLFTTILSDNTGYYIKI